jgi:hypothetical protein
VIARRIREKEIVDRWEQSMREKYGIVTPKDWQDLLRMEREAEQRQVRSSNPNKRRRF